MIHMYYALLHIDKRTSNHRQKTCPSAPLAIGQMETVLDAVPIAVASVVKEESDVTTQLQALIEMKNSGALTEDEFSAAKRKILKS